MWAYHAIEMYWTMKSAIESNQMFIESENEISKKKIIFI
jgi:hypothetical protein